MAITKSNGTVKKKHSKKDQTPKKAHPAVKLGLCVTTAGKNKRKISGTGTLKTDTVYYKKNDKVVKEKAIAIVHHPVQKYEKHKYLVKNVILLTDSNQKVKVRVIRSGNIYTDLVQ